MNYHILELTFWCTPSFEYALSVTGDYLSKYKNKYKILGIHLNSRPYADFFFDN